MALSFEGWTSKSCGTKKRCQYSHEAKPSVNTDTEFFHARFCEFSTQNECHHVSGYICNTSVWIWKHPVCEQCPFSPMVCFFFPFLLPSFCENFTNLKFSLNTHTCVSTGVGLTSDLKAHTCSVFTLWVFIFTLVVLLQYSYSDQPTREHKTQVGMDVSKMDGSSHGGWKNKIVH